MKIENTKGGEYYETTYNYNLDVFGMLMRFNTKEVIKEKFEKALKENENLALANLLYILDIRNGKGERRLFKIMYHYLCENYSHLALQIMPFIGDLGRFDYLLEGLNTPVEKETVKLIKEQLADIEDTINKYIDNGELVC